MITTDDELLEDVKYWKARFDALRIELDEAHLKSSDGDDRMEPTSRGDLVAEKVRRWYEANRESWWDRHKPGIIGAGTDRSGVHADEFMLRLIHAVYRADNETPR